MKEADIYNMLVDADRDLAITAAKKYLLDTAMQSGSQRLRLIDHKTATHLVAFEANGTKYTIRTAEEGIGLRRFTKLRSVMSQLGFEASLAEQQQKLRQIELLFNKQEYVKAAAGITDMQQALSRAGRPYPAAIEAASLFIFAEGEKETDLPTEAQTAKKADDWAEAKIHEADFFCLALQYSADWSGVLQGFSLLLAPAGSK